MDVVASLVLYYAGIQYWFEGVVEIQEDRLKTREEFCVYITEQGLR